MEITDIQYDYCIKEEPYRVVDGTLLLNPIHEEYSVLSQYCKDNGMEESYSMLELILAEWLFKK